MSELKPCPFCGGDEITLGKYPDGLVVSVSCDNCGGGIDLPDPLPSEAVQAWNTRTPSWISVDTELPVQLSAGFSRVVLITQVFDGVQYVSTSKYDHENNHWVDKVNVTHWQPLPCPPTGEDK